METRELKVRCFGKALGRIIAMKDPTQEEITLIFKVEPSPDLEIRTSTSGADFAQFTLKER